MGKFTYYYGLVAISITLLGSIFVPPPFKYLQILLLTPYMIAAWIQLTNPKKVNEATWSVRMLLVCALLVLLGVGTYYLSSQDDKPLEDPINDNKSEVASMSAEIARLSKELEKRDSLPTPTPKSDFSGLLDTIEEESTPVPLTALGKIKVKGEAELDVYEEKNSSSKVVGIAIPLETYSFFEADADWYLIDIGGSTGWIKADSVSEVN